MDVLLIKKDGEKPIEKNIGRIFRKHNKVYGYACIYQSDTDRVMEIRPQELTLTFVCSRFPRKLLKHLEKARRMSVREVEKGIYYLEGDPIPIQLLVVPCLSKENNYWLQHLRGDLRRGREIEELMERYEEHSRSRWYQSAMDLIVRANWEKVKEEPEEKIRLICEAAAGYAPDYDVDGIYDRLKEKEAAL